MHLAEVALRRGPAGAAVIEEGSGGWHTTGIHTVTSIVGAGVLGLPFSMSFLTWGGGTVVLVVAWITSLYTLWQLCNMHEWHIDGKWLRMNRYHELARYVLGKAPPQCCLSTHSSPAPKAARCLLMPCRLKLMVSSRP